MIVTRHEFAGVNKPGQKDKSEELLIRLIHKMSRSIGAFRSTTQALLNGGDEDLAFRREMLQEMELELAELQRLLENVTQLKALEKGTFRINRREIEPASWLQQVVGRWQRARSDKMLMWVVDVPQDLPPILVDADKLEQSLNNLLSNAVRHTPTGARVTFTARNNNNELLLKMTSAGPRLTPEEYDRLFDLFYTGEVQGRFPVGLGLGLHITQQLIHEHGGRLEVIRPTPEDDSLGFALVLPLAKASEA